MTPRKRSWLRGISKDNLRFYRRILAYFGEDRRLIAALVALIWVALLAGVLEGAAVGTLTDAVLSSRPPTNLPSRLLLMPFGEDRAGRVVGLAVIWLMLRATNDVVMMLREMINHRLRYNGTARVRGQLFDHLQTLSPAYHKSCPQGDAIYRLSTDSQGFFGVFDTFVGVANSALTVLVIGTAMAGFNMTITLVCLCLTPLLVVANIYFGRSIRRTSAESKQRDTDFTTFVQRALAAISLAQLFGRQRTESERFRGTVDRTIQAGMKMSWQQQLYPMVQRVIYAIGHAFVLGYGGYLVYRQQGAGQAGSFTVGAITAMLVYLGQLWEPVRRMAGFTADVQNNVAACSRVFYVLDLTPTVADAPDARPLALRPRVLELREVDFAYEPGRPVLCDVNAKIAPGQMVAFVGPSGTGKSTLLNLLARFYDPTEGALSLDAFDLRTIRLADIRAHIALVPQDSPVIVGTIAENIALGKCDASEEQIREAAELAGAARFIEELPQGYETEVSDAGQNLSGGQRQRLAIARALLSDAPILVLDEPTSGLDGYHESLILETLHRLRGRRTIILVTHSMTAAAECECIFFLHAGQIAETGTHEQLMARGGLYAAMKSFTGRTESATPQPDAA